MTRCGATAARCPRRRSASTSASPIRADAAMQGERPNIISPPGFAALRAEYDALLGEERPKLVEIISWAAGNGDRSENGDCLYVRQRPPDSRPPLAFHTPRLPTPAGVH